VTLIPGLRVTQGHRNRHGSIRHVRFHMGHGPISYRFRDIQRFQSKIAKFSHPFYFTSPVKWRCSPLELGICARVKKLECWGYRAEKKFDDLQSSGYNTPTWQRDGGTDRRTDTGRQQRPRLRI